MPPKRERRELNPRTSLWDVAALALLRLRKDRGLSHQAVADHLVIDRSNVARIEYGDTPMKLEYAERLDEWWFTGGYLTGIVTQALNRHDSAWGAERAALHARTEQFLIWENKWIPGLFQTPEYARALFTGARNPDVEGAVKKRLKDQEVLQRRPLIRCLLDQDVLRRPVGGAKVMCAQLARLLEAAQEHTVRIAPTDVGAHIGLDGAFWVMTGADGRPQAYSDALGMGRLVKDPHDVRQYGLWFDQISDLALSRPESLNLIRRTMEGLSQ